MNKKTVIDFFGWGFLLWLFGYILGTVFFFVLPPTLIGWIIMPIGVLVTLIVLFKKIKSNSLGYYLGIAVCWTVIAVILDYFFLVKVFKPADGYYKLDVFLYYGLTFLLPLIIGWRKIRNA